MNASEFTEPFDLERFRNGEPAVFNGSLRFFKKSAEGESAVDLGGHHMLELQSGGHYVFKDYRMKPKAVDDGWIKHEQQANEAYERFRQSSRGREALAAIGKAKGPAFKPLGDEGMAEIFAAAFWAHHEVWPVKKV
jgi:hypothetical protein